MIIMPRPPHCSYWIFIYFWSNALWSTICSSSSSHTKKGGKITIDLERKKYKKVNLLFWETVEKPPWCKEKQTGSSQEMCNYYIILITVHFFSHIHTHTYWRFGESWRRSLWGKPPATPCFLAGLPEPSGHWRPAESHSEESACLPGSPSKPRTP